MLTAVLLFGLAAFPRGQKPAASYEQLRDQLVAGHTDIDYKAFRVAALDNDNCFEGVDRKAESGMTQAFNAKDYKGAAAAAEGQLKLCYADFLAHAVAADAYKALGDGDQAQLHHAVATGLIRSILEGGDGKSYDSAYAVVAVAEEYTVLNVLGLRMKEQAEATHGGHQYDVLKVTDDKGSVSSIYFNIDIEEARLFKALGHG